MSVIFYDSVFKTKSMLRSSNTMNFTRNFGQISKSDTAIAGQRSVFGRDDASEYSRPNGLCRPLRRF